jgi:SAM-dependent methyltransferase
VPRTILPPALEATANAPCGHSGASFSLFIPADSIGHPGFDIWRCSLCGFSVTDATDSAVSLSYSNREYYDYSERADWPTQIVGIARRLYHRRASMLERAISSGTPRRILDVGCGPGELLSAFRARGWDVMGTEISAQVVQHARSNGHEVLHGDLCDLRLAGRSFDAIVLWHVLEHVAAPEPTLAEVRRLLKPHGRALIAVPNFGSPEARFTRGGWYHLDPPRHRWHFTRASLRRVLAHAKLIPESWSFSALEYDFISFAQSTANLVLPRRNSLARYLRRGSDRTEQRAWSGNADRTARWLTTLSVAIASLPLTLALAQLGLGPTMSVVVRPE